MIPSEILKMARRMHVRARRALAGQWSGAHKSALRGAGLAFEEVRAYTPGDDVRAIDAKVTARMGRPYVKLFAEERQRTTWLLVDRGPGMRFGSIARTKYEAAVEAAALLAFGAVSSQDRTGLITWSDRPAVIPPARGQRHALRLVRDLLSTGQPDAAADRAAGLESPVRTLARLKRARGLVFVISDFLLPRPEQILRPLCRRHEVFAVQIIDPMERELPDAGMVRLADARTGRQKLVDTGDRRFRAAYAAASLRRVAALRMALASMNIRHLVVGSDRNVAGQLVRKLRSSKPRF